MSRETIYTGDGFTNDPYGYLGDTLGKSRWVQEGHNVRRERSAPPGGRGPGGPNQRAKAQAGYNAAADRAYGRGVKRLGAEQAAASASQPTKTVRKERGAIKAFDTANLQHARAQFGRGSKEAVAARRSRRQDFREGTKRIKQTRRAQRHGGGGPGPSNAAPSNDTGVPGSPSNTYDVFNISQAAPAPAATPPPPIEHVPNVLPTMGMNR